MARDTRPLRVLYVCGVGPFSGSARSLFESLRAMPEGEVAPCFLAVDGTALDVFRKITDDIVVTGGLARFDNTHYSHYRGARWLVVLRELSHLPSTLTALREVRRRWPDLDLIHVNEYTEIIPALLAKRFLGVPVVVHARALNRVAPHSRRARWLAERLRHDVDAVIAIDENVRATLPADVHVDVIHNSFAAVVATPDLAMERRLSLLRPESLKVGFVGNLHRSKGILELIDAARLVQESGRDVEYLIVGGATRGERGPRAWALAQLGLLQDVQQEVRERVERYGLRDRVHLLGPTTDIQRIYQRMDVLCFASHFDAPGRPIFEAAFSGVPCIAAVSAPRPDTLVPGETGLTVPARDPAALADAIRYFADRRDEVARMGAAARALAHRNYDPATNARRVLDVYRRVLGRTASSVLDQPTRDGGRPSVRSAGAR